MAGDAGSGVAPVAATLDAGAGGVARKKIDVDLLHFTSAAVAVSSNVNNPRDYPEHLIDGRPETAWNGKTGLLNGKITFRVPVESHVRRIELSAGYDKKGPKGDYFLMNHRITKVEVRRLEPKPEIKIGDFALNPDERLPQPIDINKSGGMYVIKITETQPGTKKEWQELVVSEMHVMGDPGTAPLFAKARMPSVVVGDYQYIGDDGLDPKSVTYEFDKSFPFAAKSAADVCTAYEKSLKELITRVYKDGDKYPGPPDPPHCVLGAALVPTFKGSGKVKGLRKVTTNAIYGVETRFIIELDSGQAVLPATSILDVKNDANAGFLKTTVNVKSAAIDSGGGSSTLIIKVEEHTIHERYCMAERTAFSDTHIQYDYRCALDQNPIDCTRVTTSQRCEGDVCIEQ
jgi:hypothetical protein